MKHFVKFFVVTFFLLFCTAVVAEQKIVIMDLKYILNFSKAGKGAQDFLKKSYNDNLKKYSEMETALKKEENVAFESSNSGRGLNLVWHTKGTPSDFPDGTI